jgi:hypothetical protein
MTFSKCSYVELFLFYFFRKLMKFYTMFIHSLDLYEQKQTCVTSFNIISQYRIYKNLFTTFEDILYKHT